MTTIVKLIFIGFCFILGVIGLYSHETIFTSETLIDSILFVVPIFYIVLKYCTSWLILHAAPAPHPSSGPSSASSATYKSAGTRVSQESNRNIRAIIVAISMHVVLPACLTLLYACFCVFWIKTLPLPMFKNAPRLIYDLYEFSETWMKYPFLVITLFLGLLALIRFFSIGHFKKYKKTVELISFPFAVAATAVLFIHADNGINQRYVSWKINMDKPAFREEQALAFNDKEKEAIVDQIVTEYIAQEIEQLERNKNTIGDTTMPGLPLFSTVRPQFYQAVRSLRTVQLNNPDLQQDVFEGGAGLTHYYSPEEQETIRFVSEPGKEGSVAHSSNLHNVIFSRDKTELRKFLDILKDERTSFGEAIEDPRIELIEDQVKEVLNEVVFGGRLKMDIPFFSLVADKSTELLSEKIAHGLMYLLEKREILKDHLKDVHRYLSTQAGLIYQSVRLGMFSKTELVIETNRMVSAVSYRRQTDLKAMFDPPDVKKLTAFIHDFPHYPDREYIEHFIPIAAYDAKDEQAILSFDASYFKKRAASASGQQKINLLELVTRYEPIRHQLQLQEDTKEAYVAESAGELDKLLEKYPDHPHKDKILKAIHDLNEKEAFNTAYYVGRPSAFQDFFKKYGHDDLYRTMKKNADAEEASRAAALRSNPHTSGGTTSLTTEVTENPYFTKTDHFDPLRWHYEPPPIHVSEPKSFWEILIRDLEHVRL
jgi:hypothetical protein